LLFDVFLEHGLVHSIVVEKGIDEGHHVAHAVSRLSAKLGVRLRKVHGREVDRELIRVTLPTIGPGHSSHDAAATTSAPAAPVAVYPPRALASAVFIVPIAMVCREMRIDFAAIYIKWIQVLPYSGDRIDCLGDLSRFPLNLACSISKGTHFGRGPPFFRFTDSFSDEPDEFVAVSCLKSSEGLSSRSACPFCSVKSTP
jgi:hypothetical protein